jgi:hypothetical protein
MYRSVLDGAAPAARTKAVSGCYDMLYSYRRDRKRCIRMVLVCLQPWKTALIRLSLTRCGFSHTSFVGACGSSYLEMALIFA